MSAQDGLHQSGLAVIQWAEDMPLEACAQVLGLMPGKRHVLAPREGGGYPSLSATHGLGAFPWHTDGAQRIRPPRWLLLRSLGVAKTPTLLLDGATLAATADLGTELTTASWLVEGTPPFYAPVISPNREILRWNPDVMRPRGRRGITADARWQELISASEPTRQAWRQGEVLILDNWRWLHARPEIAPGDRERRLERIHCE